ncbi:hypothetical protein LCGC14_1683310 [marine sediment metagenome]|uniref:DNA methylase N-4/N-6 domain-containing protein n=1 Tax=marine sediment metagenome TaxID=412755 RepID=A0A0F9HN32_9ZZZZ
MADNDGLRVEYIPVSELMNKLHPRNPKSHDLGAIIQSYKAHGFVSPGTLDSRTELFLCGHGRTEALAMMVKQKMDAPRGIRDNGGGWECPVVVGYESESDVQALAYLAADNKLTALGGWNEPALAQLLQEVAGSVEVALESTGFSGDDLDQLLQDLGMQEEPPEDPGAQVDKVAELQEKWQVVRGDVWQVGKHRIMCGDSTCAEDVDTLRNGKQFVFAELDPIYGMDSKAQFLVFGLYTALTIALWGLDYELLKVVKLMPISPNMSYVWVFPFGHAYGSLQENPFCHHRNIYVWKNEGNIYNGNLKYSDGTVSSSVFNNPFMKSHEKPEHVYQKLLLSHSNVDSIIGIAFLGSGSMLTACEQTGRVGYGMEIAPEYVAVCLERLADMGLSPKLNDR